MHTHETHGGICPFSLFSDFRICVSFLLLVPFLVCLHLVVSGTLPEKTDIITEEPQLFLLYIPSPKHTDTSHTRNIISVAAVVSRVVSVCVSFALSHLLTCLL